MTKTQHNDLQHLFHRRFGVAAPGSPTGASKDRDQNSEENIDRWVKWLGCPDPLFDALDRIHELEVAVDNLRGVAQDRDDNSIDAAPYSFPKARKKKSLEEAE